MQPAVLAAVVLPRAQDVDAVKRAEQLVGAPERLKHLNQASAHIWQGTDSLLTAMPRRLRSADAPGISNCLAGTSNLSTARLCKAGEAADVRHVVCGNCIIVQGLAQQQRTQTGADWRCALPCRWPCRCQTVLYSMCTGVLFECIFRRRGPAGCEGGCARAKQNLGAPPPTCL